jgi:hypothetical protein
MRVFLKQLVVVDCRLMWEGFEFVENLWIGCWNECSMFGEDAVAQYFKLFQQLLHSLLRFSGAEVNKRGKIGRREN